MLAELHLIAQAFRAGADLDSIEEAIITPSRVDEDQKAALWLYAEALRERPFAASEPVVLGR
jgi:hypothetical protein